MAEFEALIREDWARDINPVDVFTHNQSQAEDLAWEMDLAGLGGLVIKLDSDKIYDSQDIANARSVQTIINLAFDKPAVRTSTGLLVAATAEQLDGSEKIVGDLLKRHMSTNEHRANQPWFLPLRGLDILALVPVES